MGIPSNCTCDDVFVDAAGKRWRLAWTYSAPTYCMEEVDPPEDAKNPLKKIGTASSFADFKRMEQPAD